MSHSNASAKHQPLQFQKQPSTSSSSVQPALIDWSHGKKSGLISLTDHSLYLRASGLDRPNTEGLAVVIEHGLGGTSTDWLPVLRLVLRFAWVYSYEHAGYYRSGSAQTTAPTAQNVAADLIGLLQAAHVAPPVVLVGHSYGGVLVRQFLADYPEEVAAMVIVDSAPEVTKVPPSWRTLLGDATYWQVVGLDANHTIPDDEYAAVKEETLCNGVIATIEAKYMGDSSKILHERLRGKQLLAAKRLSVIFCDESNDFRKVYEYAVKHGNGSEEAREELRHRLEDMSNVDESAMREHMSLSSDSRFLMVEGKDKTHNVHLVAPKFVSREIEWVFQQYSASKDIVDGTC